MQSKRATEKVQEVVKLGPTVKEGEYVFGVAHIYASFNDTFVVRMGAPPGLDALPASPRAHPAPLSTSLTCLAVRPWCA